MDYKAIAFTFRPYNGAQTGEQEDKIIDWVKNQYGGFLVAEKTGSDRHYHGQLFFDTPRKKDSVRKFFKNHLKKYESYYVNTKIKVALNIKGAVNDSFIEDYILENESKVNDKCEILVNNIPENTQEHYPSDEVVEQLSEYNLAKDKTLFELEKQYHEWVINNIDELITPEAHTGAIENNLYHWKNYDDYYHVMRFCLNLWFVDRTRIVPKRKIDRLEFCKTLYYYIMGKKSTHLILRESILSEKEVEDYNKSYEIIKLDF
tara:strand:- start:95 stop:877 length:783 start_codon:yes stop_codon:yes gene_type:complete